MAAQINVFLFYLFVFLNIYHISVCDEGVKVLNDENFEHLTQASSGSTTGDWLIAFTKDDEPKCGSCKQLDEVLAVIHKKFGQRIVVAKVLDEKKSVLIWKRFEQTSLPKLSFLRQGMVYLYTSEEFTEEAVSKFIENYNKYPNRRVPLPIGFLDVFIESLMGDIKHIIQIRKTGAFIIFCSGALFGLMLTPVCKCIGDFLISTFTQEPDPEEEIEESEGVDEVDEEEEEKEENEKKND